MRAHCYPTSRFRLMRRVSFFYRVIYLSFGAIPGSIGPFRTELFNLKCLGLMVENLVTRVYFWTTNIKWLHKTDFFLGCVLWLKKNIFWDHFECKTKYFELHLLFLFFHKKICCFKSVSENDADMQIFAITGPNYFWIKN